MKPISGGIVSLNVASRAASAWPEAYPGAGTPWNSTERSRLKRFVSSVPPWAVMVTSVPSGTISFVVLLRTQISPMSSGRFR